MFIGCSVTLRKYKWTAVRKILHRFCVWKFLMIKILHTAQYIQGRWRNPCPVTENKSGIFFRDAAYKATATTAVLRPVWGHIHVLHRKTRGPLHPSAGRFLSTVVDQILPGEDPDTDAFCSDINAIHLSFGFSSIHWETSSICDICCQ